MCGMGVCSLVCSALLIFVIIFFFKQKTAYELRISDWSSDVCSSDLVTRPTVSVAGLKADPDSPAAALMRRLTGANATIGVASTTEAGLFQRALIPAIVCGPGDIAQAHQPDEYVEIAEIEDRKSTRLNSRH